jgi:hypothetical protein
MTDLEKSQKRLEDMTLIEIMSAILKIHIITEREIRSIPLDMTPYTNDSLNSITFYQQRSSKLRSQNIRLIPYIIELERRERIYQTLISMKQAYESNQLIFMF